MSPSFAAVLCFVLVLASADSFNIPNQNDYKVDFSSLFGIPDELYAGFMPVHLQEPNSEGGFFFWLAKKRNKRSSIGDDKLVIWLNGGPGCSSMVGMMWENGPFTLHDKEPSDPPSVYNGQPLPYTLRSNPHSWNTDASVLFVEQPIRTGYAKAASGARTIKTEQEVAEDFFHFLQSFLTVFTEYEEAEVFISGESYAGFYIPYIAAHIVKKQQGVSSSSQAAGLVPHINLSGIAIGNGAIDDAIQFASYTEYAYAHGLIPLGAKRMIDDQYTRCLEGTASQLLTTDSPQCNTMGAVLDAAGRPNEYDTSTFKAYDRIIKPDGPFPRFFNDISIQELLHVRGYNLPGLNFDPEAPTGSDASGRHFFAPVGWQVCNDDINTQLKGRHPVSAVSQLQFLADHIKVMLYSGEHDLNCNTLGTLHVLEAHSWSGKRWSDATRSLWLFDADVAGEYFTLDGSGLTFLIVRNSGHLLPMDIPDRALEMINRFISGRTFADKPLLSEKYYLDILQNSDEDSGSENDDAIKETMSSPTSTSSGLFIVFAATLSVLLVALSAVKLYASRSDSDSSSLLRSTGGTKAVYSPINSSKIDAHLPVQCNYEMTKEIGYQEI